METTTTVKDILIDVNNMLGGINIPINLVESIGIPVARAINGINLCIEAMNKEEAKQAEQEKAEVQEEGEETDA